MDSVANINQSTINLYNNQNESNSANTLDENAFLRLFIESLKNQDPMEPISQSEMMEQLSQLTMIENITKMTNIVEGLSGNNMGINPLVNYFNLIGKQVRVEDTDGDYEGKVVSVGMQGQDIVFEMSDGKTFSVTQIVGVSEE